MNIEKLVLSTAKGIMTVGEYGFKGAKVVCSTGHTVANGLRTTADAIDVVSSIGENKCQEGADWCQAAKEAYKKKIIMIVQQEAAQLAAQGISLTDEEMKKLFDTTVQKVQSSSTATKPVIKKMQLA
ncbi:Uncharacterised protein [Megamonas hypermegale]|uniref:Uncharacterized protein n=1 Tax=Megamonas hypermegale TaxID=158847 RepID=A0A378NS82_9FIRM|nr:hypothetical protein [Megamonas hypermegale]STY71250.1 Uncharacterised protein [Megamonas hypermegale]